MTDSHDCHIPEWASLMDVSVPEGACEQRTLGFRQREDA
jgi:hypothetical protein